MLYFPNAKINLGLQIIEKRKDGFHNLNSIFYPIGLKDVLEIVPSDTFSCHQLNHTFEGLNICEKAFHLLKQDFQIPDFNIHLLKNIPMGAGLGGGSSDAAFTLKALNQLCQLQLNAEQLQSYARILGSDCAFFIDNKPVFAKEKGNVFEEITLDLSDYELILAMPNIHISTAEAYSHIKAKKNEVNLKEAILKPIQQWKELIVNDFEASIFPHYPLLKKVKQELYNQGALYASMSGSGACLYGLFPKNSPIPNIKHTQIYHNLN